jgi:hypothetical protein
MNSVQQNACHNGERRKTNRREHERDWFAAPIDVKMVRRSAFQPAAAPFFRSGEQSKSSAGLTTRCRTRANRDNETVPGSYSC